MIESLQSLKIDFSLYLLCLDNYTYSYFEEKKNKYSQIILIKLKNIEKYFDQLKKAKKNRTTIEYYFTLSPFLPSYIFEYYKTPHICTLDADIKFYSSPERIFNYLQNYSIVITPHKFSPENLDLIVFGKNNVSFQIFKNDNIGNECLYIWRNQCLNWCKDYLDEECSRFADQKYLDNWEILFFPNVMVLNDNVSGLAAWNLNNYNIKFIDNIFLSNNEKIIFYHFHGFQILTNRISSSSFEVYKVKINKEILRLYSDYWKSIKSKEEYVKLENKYIRNNFHDKDIDEILSVKKGVMILFFRKFYYIKNINRRFNYLLKKYLIWLS